MADALVPMEDFSGPTESSVVLASSEGSVITTPEDRPRWRLAARIAFRFCVIYFGLFCLGTQILGGLINIPNVDIPDVSMIPPIHPLVLWTARHIFGVQQALVDSGSGSGDKTFDWVMCFCFLTIALLATAVWSILDRKRPAYPGLQKWFRLVLRFALGAQMLGYGIVKVIPLQMPYPSLIKLLEPYGNFSPMGVLWSSIGASPSYEILCGSAEVLAGILLLLPWTTLLGALVTAGVASEIFVLNMTYDVPVKILSFHLLLMALFLAAPEMSRLIDFFLRNRTVGASKQPCLFRTSRANRIAVVVQLTFGCWLIGSTVYGYWKQWPVWGGGRPLSPIYGIWDVQKLIVDGHERSALVGDYGRWRRILFDSPKYMTYERMDDTFASYDSEIDEKKQSMALSKSDDKKWKGTLHYQSLSVDRLSLEGNLGGQLTHMQLVRMDRSKMTLISRGFHWVQEYPFNR